MDVTAQQTPSPSAGGQPAKILGVDAKDGGEIRPEYITRQEAEGLAREAAEAAAEAAYRRAQSYADKRQQVFNQSIEALNKALEMQRAAGITITPEQEQNLKDRVWQQAMTAQIGDSASPENSPPGTPTPGETAQGQLSDIDKAAFEIMEEYGVTIEKADPEFDMLDPSTPRKYLNSMEKAIQAKQARLQKDTGNARTPTNAGMTGGQAMPVRDFKNAREILAHGLLNDSRS